MAHLTTFQKRRQRVRTALRQRASGRPRLSVHRSGRHIYAQLIDDAAGTTLASASTLDKGVRGTTGATAAAAAEVGKRLADAAKKAGVTQVVFDRGGFLFHGRIKALADAAREGGLEF
ncbi:MAG: 50S ribosomal protein L18 [Sphingopyxis macrogoltabida]|uniref:Large ribosomal subunit protein uL18 n=1 Tax=Sphingopyxis macrogoltabida TaxID=33050 RepID=A0A2W5LA00_SPHMC|nr:MAG: 50S ribosomal protein L18 [Sphingopyxis macrogoltabida]